MMKLVHIPGVPTDSLNSPGIVSCAVNCTEQPKSPNLME